MEQQVSQKVLNAILSELEILVLWIGQDVIQETSEGYDKLTNETSNQENAVLLSMGISYIIDLNLWVVVLVSCCANNLVLNLFQELLDSVSFSSSCSLLLSLPLCFSTFSF